jgi:hypothetical protein
MSFQGVDCSAYCTAIAASELKGPGVEMARSRWNHKGEFGGIDVSWVRRFSHADRKIFTEYVVAKELQRKLEVEIAKGSKNFVFQIELRDGRKTQYSVAANDNCYQPLFDSNVRTIRVFE